MFTGVADRRQRILTQRLSRDLLQTVIAALRQRLLLEIPAIVLLPAHWHCIDPNSPGSSPVNPPDVDDEW